MSTEAERARIIIKKLIHQKRLEKESVERLGLILTSLNTSPNSVYDADKALLREVIDRISEGK